MNSCPRVSFFFTFGGEAVHPKPDPGSYQRLTCSLLVGSFEVGLLEPVGSLYRVCLVRVCLGFRG